MSHRLLRGFGLVLGLAGILAVGLPAAEAGHRAEHRLIVDCERGCDQAVSEIRALGGEVTERYRNIEAFAARIPSEKLTEVMALAGVKVYKDVLIEAPQPVTGAGARPGKGLAILDVQAEGVHVLGSTDVGGGLADLPANYSYNNNLTGVTGLHSQGHVGGNVIVAVIDSGTANAPVVPALAGSVIGGENFVPDDPVPSATSRRNEAHGTWVGCMIAGHAAFIFNNTSVLIQSLLAHSPESVIPCSPVFGPVCTPTRSVVPMIGSAPGAKIYALKVFSSLGGGSPESRVIAAMDRAITLRRNFNSGMPSVPVAGDGSENDPFVYDSLKIDVVNMSLGGGTLFAGRDMEDRLTVEMLRQGITIVASAGNSGFAAMTGGSPGTGIGSLTVGAANTPVHERVLRDVQFGLGFGSLFRASDHIQTADFSSRGPTADGRFDPDVTANGLASFAQGPTGGLNLVSGTSFSGPTTAGAAALLRGAVPSAKAIEVRNALVSSANPHLLGDNSRRIDQGRGFIDVPAALAQLQSGRVSRRLPVGIGSPSVFINLLTLGFRPVFFIHDRFQTRVRDLKPGEVAHFFVPSQDKTDSFTIKLRNVSPELPPEQQNQLFGDDVFLQVVDAPTSFAALRVADFVAGDADFFVENPQEGFVRVALQGDWTNAGKVSADLIIERARSRQGGSTTTGRVKQGDLVPIDIQIAEGTNQLVFETFWREDWGHYPTNDIDMILVDPNGAVFADGATFDSPERAVIDFPEPGLWTVFIQGFTVNTRHSHWRLLATADGVRLRLRDLR